MSPKDKTKLIFVFGIIIFFGVVFFGTPALRPSALLTLLTALLMGPWIQRLERRGVSRTAGIFYLFALSALLIAGGLFFIGHVVSSQYEAIVASLPEYNARLFARVLAIEARAAELLNLKKTLGLSEWIRELGSSLSGWLFSHAGGILSHLFSTIFLVPFFSFFILRDGPRLIKRWIRLVPNSLFEPTVVVLSKISAGLSDYIRAKTLEALAIGAMTYLILTLIGIPYAGVLSLIVGVTNIIPYLGPALGLLPAGLIIGLDPTTSYLLAPTLIAIVAVNVVDNIFVFPYFVARQVNLSAIALLSAVAVGQQVSGVVGMLISVPIAQIIKIIFQEVITVFYRQRI